jgi:signal transduction histidine kinase
MPDFTRKRRTLHWPITMSVSLMMLNVALMVGWIVLAAHVEEWDVLTIGTIAFALILVGLTSYMVLTIKEVRVSQQQANFVDSVTHELKSPIASLRAYLETMQMRSISDEQRAEFYGIMEAELDRLNRLINHLLEVGRLDAIGQESEAEDILLEPFLRQCAANASTHHNQNLEEVVRFDVEPAVVHGRPLVLQMIFGNLLDNALKYAGTTPEVEVHVSMKSRGRVLVRIVDNGQGVPSNLRKKIFQIFFRAGNELERTRQGTGLGLYIVKTLVHIMKGKITVRDRGTLPGSSFEVELPGRAAL